MYVRTLTKTTGYINCFGVMTSNFSQDGAHALHVAVESGSEEIAQSLFDHGALADCINDVI